MVWRIPAPACRSPQQKAAARSHRFQPGWPGFGGGGGGRLRAYANTAEGKIVACRFLDNWNNVVAPSATTRICSVAKSA